MEVLKVFLLMASLIIVVGICYLIADTRVEYLERENRILRRLLSDQARLHKMSLDAYIAMLREAQRHTDCQHFDR